MSQSKCSSSCPTPGAHESYGECLRSKNLNAAVSIPGNGWDRSVQKDWVNRPGFREEDSTGAERVRALIWPERCEVTVPDPLEHTPSPGLDTRPHRNVPLGARGPLSQPGQIRQAVASHDLSRIAVGAPVASTSRPAQLTLTVKEMPVGRGGVQRHPFTAVQPSDHRLGLRPKHLPHAPSYEEPTYSGKRGAGKLGSGRTP